MTSRINVIALIDVVGALSDRTPLNGNVSVVDDSVHGSRGQGTTELCTLCHPGQLIKWSALAVDVQTPVVIKSISFLGPDQEVLSGVETSEGSDLDLKTWEGVVPSYMTPGIPYRYRFEWQMYEGPDSTMHIDTLALMCPA